MRTATTKRESRILPIRIDSLEVPRAGEAQREFSQAHGDAIAAEFDMGKFGYPVVNQVDQTNWVVDGQHRVYALRKQPAETRGTTLECEVYENLNKQEMADLFLGRNRSRIVNVFERFTVAVTAGHAREQAIMRVVHGRKTRDQEGPPARGASSRWAACSGCSRRKGRQSWNECW